MRDKQEMYEDFFVNNLIKLEGVYTVYALYYHTTKLIKIGYSSNTIRRWKQIQGVNAEEVSIMAIAPRINVSSEIEIARIEKEIHNQLQLHHVRGEFFKPHYDVLDVFKKRGHVLPCGITLDEALQMTKRIDNMLLGLAAMLGPNMRDAVSLMLEAPKHDKQKREHNEQDEHIIDQ